ATFDDDVSLDFNALSLRAGAQVSTYFGAEVEADIGLGSETVGVEGFDVDVKLEHALGAFVTARLPVGEGFDLTARAGYADAKLSADAGFGEASGSDDGFAFGAGARFFPGGGKNGLRVDYTR